MEAARFGSLIKYTLQIIINPHLRTLKYSHHIIVCSLLSLQRGNAQCSSFHIHWIKNRINFKQFGEIQANSLNKPGVYIICISFISVPNVFKRL